MHYQPAVGDQQHFQEEGEDGVGENNLPASDEKSGGKEVVLEERKLQSPEKGAAAGDSSFEDITDEAI